jgi:hypothetical protein
VGSDNAQIGRDWETLKSHYGKMYVLVGLSSQPVGPPVAGFCFG